MPKPLSPKPLDPTATLNPETLFPKPEGTLFFQTPMEASRLGMCRGGLKGSVKYL